MTDTFEHIDRKSLYTNLEARIDYLHRFLDFNEYDLEALAFGSKFVKDLIPAVVHVVYQKLLQFDITARAFQVRDTRSEAAFEIELDENSPELLTRKMFLTSYLTKICSDQSKMAFWEYLDQVGAMHVGLNRSKPLNVEYIHISATLCLIQHVLTEAILSHNALPMSKRMAMVKALSKVIWIQNDLFAKWYVRDGDEFTGGKSSDTFSRLGASNKSEGAGVCPFSGITKSVQEVKISE
ncbi:Protoglobin-domain-containing protein [Dactylonectria macrodidyma]|uniref:Protoglobin-domain-containing protein n=1 Tax=Dactylonectria macrodidyma TaxID=307937 RepID=A0A9P9FNJ0_9HYPO|nr:Protoglobin-domain-containing protein [Dactylonectria macrodidyma]